MKAAEITIDTRAGEFSDVIAGISAAAITDDDVERFYNSNAEQMKLPLADIRDELKRALEASRRAESTGTLIRTLVQSGQLTFAGQLTGEP